MVDNNAMPGVKCTHACLQYLGQNYQKADADQRAIFVHLFEILPCHHRPLIYVHIYSFCKYQIAGIFLFILIMRSIIIFFITMAKGE